MNNEEAIKYGIEWLEDEYLDAGDRAFIELALEALKQIPVITTTGEGGVIYYPQVEGVTPTVIDAGKQEPCEDAISRQAVQDYIAKYLSQYLYNDVREAVEVIDEYIGELPPVNPTKTGWIPVSERLPEDSGEYLVTVIDEDVETYKHTGIAWYAHPKDYDVEEGDWRELMIDEKVIAWMPLPKTYEPQESERKV